MLFGKYQFFCRLENDSVLPCYKGSTFRGVFGWALKRVVCALKKEECENCLLRQRCIYPIVFETPVSVRESKDSTNAVSPHPFVIEPPLNKETNFSKDSPFDFHLLLFGEVNRNLPYFIYAFEQMGKIGIGKKINGKRGNFVLEKMKSQGQVIYTKNDQKLNKTDSFEKLCIQNLNESKVRNSRLRINMITPLRFKYQNRLKAELPFHVLVRAMLRRISSLYNCYGEGEPSLDYGGLVKRAEDVQIVGSELTWFDWQRYSNRQDKSMLMGGISGSITYKGDIGEYMPLIDFCSKVHIGKQTSFGLGKIEAEVF